MLSPLAVIVCAATLLPTLENRALTEISDENTDRLCL